MSTEIKEVKPQTRFAVRFNEIQDKIKEVGGLQKLKKELVNFETRDLETSGDSLTAVYAGRRLLRNFTDEKTGEEKELWACFFQDAVTLQKFKMLENAGLRSAIQDAQVEPGHLVTLTYKGKVELSKGRTMNMYAIEVFEV